MRWRRVLDGRVRRLLRTPGPPPAIVDQAVVGDAEDPAPQGGAVAAEAMDVARDLQEDLAQQVLGLGCTLRPQVAEDRGRQRAIGVSRVELAQLR